MNIVRLAKGAAVPEGGDWVSVEEMPDGSFNFIGGVSVSPARSGFRAQKSYLTYAEAELAAQHWAAHHGSKTLYICESR